MGLLTLDVTALGVVMTSDSNPVEIISGGIRVLDFTGQHKRDKIIERHASGFDGLIGYVGTEQIGAQSTRAFIEGISATTPDLALNEFVAQLGDQLSAAWANHRISTGLDVFVAGAERGELRFWFLRNATFDKGLFFNIRRAFTKVNDLDRFAIPREMREHGLASKDAVLQRIALFYRTGALIPAAPILDAFQVLVSGVYAGGYAGFEPMSSLAEYTDLVRMRQEFVKRLFMPAKGLYRGGKPPIGGVIHIRSVSATGEITEHMKNASART